MNINKIDHISIAVKDLEAAKLIWQPVLGKTEPDESYEDNTEQIRVARYYVGEVGVELMESLTDEGEVARFIKTQGEGIMLLSLGVNSVKDACRELEDQNYPLVGPPRSFRNGEFNFIHPSKMNGVLLELIDEGEN
tara:strand:- start:238 stop:645 length:408 start_codon:yes stop_codon:yes gene_type:complete